MLKYIVLLISFIISFEGQSQTVNENWSGILNAGPQKIELRLHLIKKADNSYISNWDVPIQKAKGISSSQTELNNFLLTIEIKAIGATYEGKINASGDKIEGTWGQSGKKFILNLEPFINGQNEVVITKPQTPKPPFTYQSKDIVYEGLNTKLSYGATLTYPNDQSKFPLVILITGSGQQDRDESIFGHKPFAVIADYLTKKGFAVLRIDDRGTGKSTGDFHQSTTADFALDVDEHINYAKSLPMIDTNRIGLLGHSEGGIIAPMVAAHNKSVSFIILMAGPGIVITELMAIQNEMVQKSAGLSQKAIDSYIPLYRNLMKTIVQTESKTEALIKAKELILAWYNSTDKEDVKVTSNINSEADIEKFATIMTETLSTKWWKFFAVFNPQNNLQKIKCPVLAINGGADIQVPADVDLKGIEDALKKAKNKNVTIKKFDGLNHLFQKCTKCTVPEYGELETTIEPEVLEYIGSWVLNLNKIK